MFVLLAMFMPAITIPSYTPTHELSKFDVIEALVCSANRHKIKLGYHREIAGCSMLSSNIKHFQGQRCQLGHPDLTYIFNF